MCNHRVNKEVMKRVLVSGIIGVFLLGITACSHEICYMNSSDPGMDRTDHNQKVEMVQELTEAQK